jgi:hypothetical protein
VGFVNIFLIFYGHQVKYKKRLEKSETPTSRFRYMGRHTEHIAGPSDLGVK